MNGPAIVVLGPGGLKLARKLKRALPGAVLHGYAPRLGAGMVDRRFADVAPHLRALFQRGTPIL
ncbi:MAG: precorrin-3B C(17)-methyltransferase, partial [Rhodospirillales bacterium]